MTVPSELEVPSELAVLPRWVNWQLERRYGKLTKIPYQPDGEEARANDPKTWNTLEVVAARSSNIGFVLGDPYMGIDMDGCIKGGLTHPDAQAVVDYYNSYTETSPSATGIHIIARGHVGSKQVKVKMPWGGNLEAYDYNHYFTFTGQRLNGLTIRSAEFWHPGDDRIIDKARQNAPKFVLLFDEGDCSGYNSQSEADLSLANIFAARTKDPDQIERLMWRSALAREKWNTPDSGSTNLIRRVIEPALASAVTSKDSSPIGWTRSYEEDVSTQMYMAEVRSEAHRRIRIKDVPEDLGLTDMNLAEQLAMPRTSPTYRIDGLQTTRGNILLVARYKSGKTALLTNLLKALADNVPFLDEFEVDPFEGNIAVFNYEEDPEYWLSNVECRGIERTDRIWPLHRRGMYSLPIWDKEGQDKIVEWMIKHEIVYWIMDPAAVAWIGLVDNENDNALITQFTVAIDQVKYRAGISEVLLTHHSGREDATRARGATRLEDWKEAGWLLERDKDTNIRTFSADGRRVDVAPIELEWTEAEWKLSAGEGLQEQAKKEGVAGDKELKRAVIEILQDQGEMSYSKLSTALRAAGIKFNQNKLKGKLAEWSQTPTTPGLGFKQEGQRHLYYWRKK